MRKDNISMNTDLSYLAGYIDGDGCFYIGKNINPIKYRSGIIISSTNKDTLRYFWKRFKGNVQFGKKNTKFKTYNPINQWYIGGENALLLATELLPLLHEKKKCAELYIQFVEQTSRLKRDSLIFKMKQFRKTENNITREEVEKINSLTKETSYNKNDVAYLAGFIDSECALCLSRYKRKTTGNFLYKALIQCNNTKTPPITYIKEKFGGSCSFVPRNKTNPLHKDQICWRISAAQLKPILPLILPFLKNKRVICEKLIEFTNTILNNGGDRQKGHRTSYFSVLQKRDVLFNQISHLNSKTII